MNAMFSFRRTAGQLVADVLAGCWRPQQSPLNLSPTDLGLVTSLLYDSGGAGLAWWRIHESGLRATSTGELLQQAYRLQILRTAIQEERLVTIFRFLRAANIEPILVKGWSLARLYPNSALRSYGDIDLLVNPQSYRDASAMLGEDKAHTWWVDLHKGLSELSDRSFDELFARSQLVDLAGTRVRVLCSEDIFALVALHFFKHGGWRPSWLCDIGVMLEAVWPGFNWKVCLGSDARKQAWIASAIALAQELLGANVVNLPASARVKTPPDWLLGAVLNQWGNLTSRDHLPVIPRPLLAHSLFSPAELIKEVRARWPDPITATFNLNGGLTNLPRFPYQLGAFAAGAGRYLIDSLGRVLARP